LTASPLGSFGKSSVLLLALIASAIALTVAIHPDRADAANGTCENQICKWNCNPQAGQSWCWFDAVGGNNARNWFYDDGWDGYANHVWKCAAAIRASNGTNWASTCNNNQLTWQRYSLCNCGGLYVRTWNGASEPRNLSSTADY
jgi:hypothetical protein